MAEEINAKCSICGKGYHLCVSCKSIMDLNPWKRHTDTSEHYKIFQIIRGYSIKVYNKEEAKQKLQNVDLSDLHELRENIQKIIAEIMSDDCNKQLKVGSHLMIENQTDSMPKTKIARKKRATQTDNVDVVSVAEVEKEESETN